MGAPTLISDKGDGMEKLKTGQIRPETALEADKFGIAAGIGSVDEKHPDIDLLHVKHTGADYMTHDEIEFSKREVMHEPIVMSKFMAHAVQKGLEKVLAGDVPHEQLPPAMARQLSEALGRIATVERPTVPAPLIPDDDTYIKLYAPDLVELQTPASSPRDPSVPREDSTYWDCPDRELVSV